METPEPFDNVDFLLGDDDKGFEAENGDGCQQDNEKFHNSSEC